ncbi:hypothetical protein [Frisingicoccus sp.]|uniref:hypothetical protein n=1 Tax=Frisingicoccus sp. TaxID=1918627 RepID=UPI0025C2B1F7|nr:hypothetical protein [Frisingicoccus sp.]
MYAKLVNNTPRYTSKPPWVTYNGKMIGNAPDEILAELGYHKVQETEMPNDAPEGKHYESHLEYADGVIKQVWSLVYDPAIQEPEVTISDLESAIKEAINSDN